MAATNGTNGHSEDAAFYSFKGQRAVVFAGTEGIGFGAAQYFIKLGGEVIVTSRTQSKVNEAVAKLGPKATGYAVDGTDEKEVAAFFERVGPFDHLISSSGRGRDKPFLQSTIAELRATWEPKYFLYLTVTRLGAPFIKPGGTITLISGGNSVKPGPNSTQAAAINSAVEGFGRALAKDLAPVRVNVVSPGLIDTPLWTKINGDDPTARQKLLENSRTTLPARTVGTSEEVGRLITALISSPFSTGSVLTVNGGAFLV